MQDKVDTYVQNEVIMLCFVIFKKHQNYWTVTSINESHYLSECNNKFQLSLEDKISKVQNKVDMYSQNEVILFLNLLIFLKIL